MVEILVALIVIGVVYVIAKQFLPEPIPLATAALLFVFFVLVPLLHHAH
jgi:chromate transport protein ChrA